MKVRLTVIGDHRQSLGDRAEHVFTEAGGVVGRSPACDWALPDQSKTLSSRHATIGFTDGVFVVTDTSTNGVYLNTVDAPLGRGATTPLRAGDILYLGPYAISVEPILDRVEGRQKLGVGESWMAVRAGAPAPRPVSDGPEAVVSRPAAADPLAGLAPPPRPATAFPGAAASAPPTDPLFGLTATDDDAIAGVARRREDDLLAPVRAAAVPSASAGRGSQPIIPPEFDPVAPPPPAGRIPTRFLLPELGDDVPSEPSVPVAPLLPPLPPLQQPAPAARPLSPAVEPGGDGRLPPPPAPRPADPREGPATDVMALLRLRALAAGTPVETGPATRTGTSGEAAADRLLAAIGVDAAALGPREAAAAADALGAFIIEAAEGLVAVLEARRSARDELRLEHTRLGPAHNNPFKFFGSGREVVQQIVERRAPGFSSLAAGAREGFDDIKAHELATMAAIHAVAAALVARLSPAGVESAVEAGGLFGRADKARLWDRFVDQHGRLAETLDVTVNELVAREFARAYRRHAAGDREEID